MAQSPLTFQDLKVGQEAPSLTHTLGRTDLVKYAGASGDYNPMHTDEVAAQGAGQPSVFGHGMFSMGFLATALTHFVGVGNLTRYKVRFARQTWPGEELTTKIVVSGTRQEDGRDIVDLDVRLVNGAGEDKVVGEASAIV
jgi:acyl dehydratase